MVDTKNQCEIFRGHLEECLRHLDGILGAQGKKAMLIKKMMADFCGTQIQTVNRWMNKQSPCGENLIRLTCLLDLMGFKVIEFERMSAVIRNFSELIGFKILTNTGACHLLGYLDATSVYGIFKGVQGTSKEKNKKMFEIWKERKLELEQRKETERQKFAAVITALSGKKSEPKASNQMSLPLEFPAQATSRQKAAIEIMKGLLLLLERNFDGTAWIGDNGDAVLRLNSTTILQLTAHLNELSSRLISPGENRGAPDGQKG